MSHHIARVSHEQGALFPLHLDDFVRPDHLVRVIAAYVDRVDVRQLGFANAVPPERGRPSYAPQDLLKLYVYAYINGLQSSRRMETECERNVELLWLMGRLKPDHKTIAVFRQGNEPAIKGVCAAFVQFCREQGQLVSRQVAVDGTKLRAAASPRRLAMAKQLEKKLKELEERIARFLKLLDENDKSEQTEADLGGDLDWVRAALERLRTQKGELEGLKKAVEASGREGLVTNEAEARVMQCTGKAAAVPAYNAQFAVSTDTHLIVHHALTQDVNDRQQLAAMADGAREALGLAVPPAGDGQDLPQPQMQVLADAGYSSAEQAAQCEARGIEPCAPRVRAKNQSGFFDKSRFTYDETTNTYICPAGQRLHFKQRHKADKLDRYEAEGCAGCPLQGQCTKGDKRTVSRSWHEASLERMDARVKADSSYMLIRRSTAEHPFGTLKRKFGGRFLTRGLKGAGTELALQVLSHNFLRLFRLRGAPALLAALA